MDVVSTVCPCAGLSMLSHGYGDDNAANRWMENVTKYVLEDLRPKVYWGENAPGFAGKVGEPVRNRLIATGQENGYTMTVYRTKSALHGLGQVRERSFYFFWDKKYFAGGTPLLGYYDRPQQSIEDTILAAAGNFQADPINPKTPSKDDPIYRYVLEEIHGGIDHRAFFDQLQPISSSKGKDVQAYAEHVVGRRPAEIAAWLRANGYERRAYQYDRRQQKQDDGLNVMYRGTIVPKGGIGAYVNPTPLYLTHPHEDRYISTRESLAIMGMPLDFELVNPRRNYNHVCQNVPVQTAADMATEVLGALYGQRHIVDAGLVYQTNHNKTHRIESTATLESFYVG